MRELGVKAKVLTMVRDEASMNEVKQASDYYFGQDELYPMQNYSGQPEFELFNRDNFNVDSPEELPCVTYMSNTQLNELAPQHNDNTLNYQDLHPELERWAIFRALPNVMAYDKKMLDVVKSLSAGTLSMPAHL